MNNLCSSLLALALFGPACANASDAPAGTPARTLEQPQPPRPVGEDGSLAEARSWLDRGDADRALAITDDLLARDGNDRAARLLAARANLHIVETELRSNTESLLADAARNLELALDQDGEDPGSWYLLADVYLKQSEFDDGIEAAQTAAAQWSRAARPTEAADAMLRAADNAMQQFVDLRRTELSDGTPGPTGVVPPSSSTAEAAQAVAKFCGAAASQRPGPAHARVATVKQWLSDNLGAIEELERGIARDPAHEPLHTELIRLRSSMGQHREAVAAYREMARSSEAPILRWHMGRAQITLADEQRRLGQSGRAASSYEEAAASFAAYAEAVPAHSQSATWWRALCTLSRARLAIEQGNLEIGEALLLEAHEIDPRVADRDDNGYPVIYHGTFGNSYEGDLFKIGKLYAEMGGHEGNRKALEFFERTTSRHPGRFGQFYSNAGLAARDLGALYAQEGNTQKAQELWEHSYDLYCKAVELEPNDPRIVNDCGLMLIYHLHRDYDRARELFDQAIAVGTPLFEALGSDANEDERNFVEEALGDAYQNIGVLLTQQNRDLDEIRPFLETAVTFYPYQRRQAARMLRRGAMGQPLLGASEGTPAAGNFRPQDPQDPRAKAFAEKITKADELAARGNFDGALIVMDDMAAEMKGFAPFHYKAGQFNLGYAKQKRDEGGGAGLVSGLFEDAKRQLQKAVELDSEPFGPRAALSEAHYEMGEYQEAAKIAAALILHMNSTGKATAEDLQGAHKLRASAAARAFIAAKQNGETNDDALTDARTSFKGLHAQKALAEADYTLWSNLEEWAGAKANAMDALAQGLEHMPDSGVLLGAVVETGARTNESRKAIEALADRSDATGIWYRGRARFHAAEDLKLEADFDAAAESARAGIADFEASMRQNADFTASCQQWKAFCLAKLASLQLLQKKFDDAETNIMEAVELRPDQIDGYISDRETIKLVLMKVADRYYQARDLENTERIYRRAVELVPTDATLNNNHGLFARDYADALGRSGGATEETRKDLYERSYTSYRRAVDLDPENVRLRNDCALISIYHLKRNWEESKTLLEGGIATGERQLGELDLAGDALNNLEEAVGDCYENLALWHLQHGGDLDAAIAAAEKSMEYYPGQRRGGARRHLRTAQERKDGGK